MAGASSSSSSPESVYITSFKHGVRYVGTVKRNCETDEEYTAFYGIPYAKVPEGLKRYQAPESLPLGEVYKMTTYEANVTKKCSTQFLINKVRGSADCLYLNIFIPRRPEHHKNFLPVLVYFHGGGFTFGSNHPQVYTPDSIIQHGVIFVTVNYRLGLHGFLNWHSEICPGNAGLKDQVKALQWIRDNIYHFRGDHRNVTISGNSAGGTCVNLHLISPMSKGLFHKAIVQSGGIYSAWGYRGHRREMKETLLKDWECRDNLFLEEDEAKLHKRAHEVLLADREIRHPFSLTPLHGPTMETIKDGAFIYGGIEEMMKNVEELDIPVMAGITENEGVHVFVDYVATTAKSKDNHTTWISDHHRLLRFLVDSFRWHPKTAALFIDLIREKYCPRVQFMSTIERRQSFAKLLHDIYFRRFYDNFKFGPKKTLPKNFYVYQFAHYSPFLFSLICDRVILFPGVATHGDELKYLYCPTLYRKKYQKYMNDPHIKQVMYHICSLWANFCKTGVPKSDFAPRVQWRRHTEEKPCYLRISNELVLKEESLGKGDWNWLNSIVNNQPTVQSRPPSP